jgi:hypothetical protein
MRTRVWHTGDVVPTEHGTPALAGLLDMLWSGRRANEFDQAC